MADINLFVKDFDFSGKHADMIGELCSEIDEESGAKIFSSFIELFIFAPIVGILCDRRSTKDKSSKKHRTIFASQFSNHISELELVFKFVILLGNKDKFNEIERLNKAFRNPKTEQNYNLFLEYVYGGIEELYEKLKVSTNLNYIDYLSSLSDLLESFDEKEKDDSIDFDLDEIEI